MVKKIIILGIGIFIILLALAGTGSARFAYASDCSYCHSDYPRPLTAKGAYFNDTHKFNGLERPASGVSCVKCHVDPGNAVAGNFALTTIGLSYSSTHRYNSTTLGSKLLPAPGCANCHVNAVGGDFARLTGTPTFLTSATCKGCHSAKYDTWYNTTHRVKLVDKEISRAAGFPTPPGYTWDDILYTIGGKWKIRYVNTTGYVITGTQAQYNVEEMKWVAYNTGIVTKYDCGGCHTTGYDKTATSRFGLAGFVGNWTENGVGCEACHGAGGNGHQVVVNKSAETCGNCHTRNAPTKYDIDPQRRHRAQFADWINSNHAPPSVAPVTTESCRRCHSPIDFAESKSITSTTAKGIVCVVCHNSHDVSDPMYADIIKPGAYGFNPGDNSSNFAAVKPAKVSFFNSSATRTAGKDVYDTLTTPALIYDRDSNYPGPINVTGPISEVLCSKCHYNHGIAHIGQVNLTHGKAYGINKATCTDCHMAKSRRSAGINSFDIRSHTMKRDDGVNYTTAPINNFPDLTCSRGTQCHVPNGTYSVVPNVNEWEQSKHNDKVNGGFYANGTTPRERASSCSQCHSPVNWNPVNGSSLVRGDAFRGITCAVCHNIHDMGDWLARTKAQFGEAKAYAWYDRDAIVAATDAAGVPTRYKANYSMKKSTTDLCGNCHANIREGRSAPGWASATATTPITPHGFPAKDIFVGSWKESSVLKFECKDCHMATKIKDSDGNVLPDSQKVKGHSFKVNATLLQSSTACSSCHVTGSKVGDVSKTIETIQEEIHAKWNTTNTIVTNALNNVNAYAGEKNLSRTKIAQAYWNLRLVSSDASWGVHNPVKVNQLLDEAVTNANQAIASLPAVTHGNTTIGMYQNSTGTFSLKNSNTGGAADITVVYSPVNSTDIPLVGDWDGSGNDTIGIYNSSAGSFNLKNKNSAGKADVSFRYGDAGDIPLVGDWNDDGIDTIGVYRNGVFYLRNVNTPGNADLTFGYGNAGDIPLVGDWNNDGNDTVGIYRSGVFYLRNNNTPGYADVTFGYGDAGDKPLAGDWNNDDTDTVGIYRNGSFYLRNSNTPGYADLQFVSEITGDTPIVGDWDGQ